MLILVNLLLRAVIYSQEPQDGSRTLNVLLLAPMYLCIKSKLCLIVSGGVKYIPLFFLSFLVISLVSLWDKSLYYIFNILV